MKLKNMILVAAMIVAASASTFGQKSDESKKVFGVIETMFAEMANHNPAGIAALWTKDSNLAALVTRRDGKKQTVAFSGEAFSKNFAEKRNEIKEVMYKPTVEIDGDLAMVFGRYVFFSDGKLSHCGLNAFHLIRIDGTWKIANAISSMEPTGCNKKEKSIKPPAMPEKK